ncbi:transglutaminase family protein [Novosphingobium sp. MW5]|nr:transglutaminase family protein [Novosphingobium sp. MW5]
MTAPIRLAIETELDYTFEARTAVLLQIEAAMIPEQRVDQPFIAISPVQHFARIPGHDDIGDRIWLDVEDRLTVSYRSEVTVQRLVANLSALSATPTHLLPAETVDYLMPSRYCQADHFEHIIESEFAGLAGGAAVEAMREWIASHFTYVPGVSTSATGALESYVLRQGVCRDYAHMLITLARAAGVPARFVSGYAPGVTPPDFHAVAEVFLDGTRYLVDATGMASGADFAKIGVGRDAADTSFLTHYAGCTLNRQDVRVTAL